MIIELFCIQAPAVFFLNLTIPVVDYGKEDHNWNKWLNVLHCITMPVFSVMAMKGLSNNFDLYTVYVKIPLAQHLEQHFGKLKS